MSKVSESALAAFIDAHGLDYSRGKRSYVFRCPRCSKRKLAMFKDDGKFRCWVCVDSGFKGEPELALSELTGISEYDIRKEIRVDPGDDVDAQKHLFELNFDFLDEDDGFIEDVPEAPVLEWPWNFYPLDHASARRGLEYALGRGLSLEVCRRYDVRYHPEERRLIFPIKRKGKLRGWQARAVFPTSYWDQKRLKKVDIPKTLTTGTKDDIFMFEDNLIGSEVAVICEGPVDALKVEAFGGAVAIMGKTVSSSQLQILRDYKIKRVYVAVDPDLNLDSNFRGQFHGLEVYLVDPKAKDLGEMKAEDAVELVRASRPWVEGIVRPAAFTFPTMAT